jgi:hypothetical protein
VLLLAEILSLIGIQGGPVGDTCEFTYLLANTARS